METMTEIRRERQEEGNNDWEAEESGTPQGIERYLPVLASMKKFLWFEWVICQLLSFVLSGQ